MMKTVQTQQIDNIRETVRKCANFISQSKANPFSISSVDQLSNYYSALKTVKLIAFSLLSQQLIFIVKTNVKHTVKISI